MARTYIAALLILLAGLSARAHAATFHMQDGTIVMHGRIVASDPLRLSELIAKGARAIVLESPGGLVAAGAYMAQMIHTAGLKTIVRGDCASACTIMFYAGRGRELSGRLGFHQATDAVGTANYAAEMQRYGAPREAINALMTTPSSRITWMR